jgi:hypothetical protein
VWLAEFALCAESSKTNASGVAMDQLGATAEKGSEAALAVAGVMNFVWEVVIVGAELSVRKDSFVEAE